MTAQGMRVSQIAVHLEKMLSLESFCVPNLGVLSDIEI